MHDERSAQRLQLDHTEQVVCADAEPASSARHSSSSDGSSDSNGPEERSNDMERRAIGREGRSGEGKGCSGGRHTERMGWRCEQRKGRQSIRRVATDEEAVKKDIRVAATERPQRGATGR